MESTQPAALPVKTPKQLTNAKHQYGNSPDGPNNGSDGQKGREGQEEDEAYSPVDEAIDDETPNDYGMEDEADDNPDQKYIEDFYEDDAENDQNSEFDNPDQLDMDMDYSKT